MDNGYYSAMFQPWIGSPLLCSNRGQDNVAGILYTSKVSYSKIPNDQWRTLARSHRSVLFGPVPTEEEESRVLEGRGD